MKLIFRPIANAITLVPVMLFILLALTFTVAPKAAAAVISNLFRLELESPFWIEGGVIFLAAGILWVGGALLAAGGGTLLFEHLARGLAHNPGGKGFFNKSSANVDQRGEPEFTLEPRPTPADSPAGQSVTPQRDEARSEAPLNLQEVCDETEHPGLHRRGGHNHGGVVHAVRAVDRIGAGSGLRRI